MIIRIALAAVLLATPLAAQEVPEPLRGAWFTGDCADPAGMLALTGRTAARIEGQEPALLFRFAETRAVAGYTLGVAIGPEAPRLLFRATADGLETIEPDPKTRDDRLPGDAPAVAWRRCETPPAALAALHGEGIAFMAALEQLEAACAGAPAACVGAIVGQGDVSGDGVLTPAELARLIRGAAWLIAVQEGAAPEALGGAVGGGALGGMIAARLLVESLDYDGDGKLSAAELMQDRGSGFARAAGTPLGQALRLDGLADGAGLLRGLVEGLLDR